MTAIPPIEALTTAAAEMSPAPAPLTLAPASEVNQNSFVDMLSRAGAELEGRIDSADELTHRFVIGDDVPAHEVILALEQARLAVELAVEVRTRTIEAYREIMNMQL